MVRVVLVGSLNMNLVMIHPIFRRLGVYDWEAVVSTAAKIASSGRWQLLTTKV